MISRPRRCLYDRSMKTAKGGRDGQGGVNCNDRAASFRFFLDFDKNASQMDPTIESVSRTPVGPTRPGTAFRFSQRIFGRMRDTTTTFTSIEPNRKIEIAARFGPLRPRGAFTFDEGNQGTTVTVRVSPNPVGPFKFLAPLFARVAQKIWTERFARIKTALESSPRSAALHRAG
jgi:Polyketide cyclase / dehydrase and lipid transport